MKTPMEFFYQTTTSATGYQEEPTESFDLDRLCRGNPDFWLSSNLSQTMKKKKLVLADWTAMFWDEEKIRHVKEFLKKLLEEGFEIYMWQNDGVMPLTEKRLFYLDLEEVQKQMLPPPRETLLQSLKTQYRLASDEVQILDEEGVNRWFTSSDTSQHVTLQEIRNKKGVNILFAAWLKENHPQLYEQSKGETYRYLPLTDEEIDDWLTHPERHMPLESLETLSIYAQEAVSLDKVSALFEFLRTHALKLKTIESDDFLPVPFCKIMSQFNSFVFKVNSHTIQETLSNISQAEHLTLIDASHLEAPLDVDCPRLTSLYLSNFFALIDDYACLLTHLKSLYIKGLFDFKHKDAFKSWQLHKLERLSLRFERYPSEELGSFIESLTALKELQLTSLLSRSVYFTKRLISLETLTCHDIYPEALRSLLTASPNLKKLILEDSMEQGFELSKVCLEHLEILDLKNSCLNVNSILWLLAAAPNLKHIVFPWGSMHEDAVNDLLEFLSSHNKKLISVDFAGIRLQGSIDAKNVGFCKNLETVYGIEGLSEEHRLLFASHCQNPKVKSCFLTSSAKLKASDNHPVEKTSENLCIFRSADTSSDLKGNARLIFHPVSAYGETPHLSSYRGTMFQEVIPNANYCHIQHAFIYQQLGNLDLEDCILVQEEKDSNLDSSRDYYLGKQSFELSDSWQPMASLSADEQMIRYHVIPEVAVEIKYSKRDQLYYVRRLEGQEPIKVSIDFTIQVPPENQELTLPDDIEAQIERYRNFKEEALLTTDVMNGEDYLQAIETQEKGACLHRSVAFHHWMKKHHPEIKTRVVENDCHQFVELNVHGLWIRRDLGGYPMELTVLDEHNPESAPIHTLQHAPQVTPKDREAPIDTEDLQRVLRSEEPPLRTGDVKEYVQQLLQPGANIKRLVQCASTESLEGLYESILHHALCTSKPVFYVQSPDDLSCKNAYMARQKNNRGKLHPGPGGPLYDFLKAHPDGIVVVNYANFKPADWVRFNTLIDEERKVDSIPIPKKTTVIGLIHQALPVLPGSDFYSRFNQPIKHCKYSPSELQVPIPGWPILEEKEESEAIRIRFYQGIDWKQLLLGRWMPRKGGGYEYQEGVLSKALLEGKSSFVLDNAPWHDPSFVRFWRDALKRGVIQQGTRSLRLPPLKLTRHDGYPWESLRPIIQYQGASPTEALILNPSTFHTFFETYDVKKSALSHQLGHIHHATDKLSVFLTHPLNEHQWAKLLTTCQEKNLTLELSAAPNVSLPAGLEAPNFERVVKHSRSTLFESTDEDATISLLKLVHPDAVVIDVSECEAQSLLWRIRATPELIFTKTESILIQAIKEGKKVILTGHFSERLAQSLTPYLMKDEFKDILIVSNDLQYFKAFEYTLDKITDEDIKDCLELQFNSVPTALKPLIGKAPLAPLKAIGRAMLRGTPYDNLWQGLLTSSVIKYDPGPLNTHTSQNDATLYHQNRFERIDNMLYGNPPEPYICLTGMSGTGKTTFVREIYGASADVTLKEGEENLEAWLQDTTPGKKHILFIDEGNLSQKQWSELNGLFQTPTQILIRGKLMTVPETHRIIFATNPASYGDERKTPPLFMKHGACVEFEPLPSAVLYEDILKPVFQGTRLEAYAPKLCNQWIEIYRFLCSKSTQDVLITPRELQMIAILTIAYCEQPGHTTPPNPGHVATWFAHRLCRSLVPEPYLAEYTQKFGQFLDEPLPIPEQKEKTDFVFTPSRLEVSALLDTFLSVHESRVSWQDEKKSQSLCSGGTNGLVLEGEPGVGKSEIMIASMRRRGYQEVHEINASTPIKSFYRMPISASLKEKEEILRKAFRYGILVVIDEINSAPTLERLLNTLLMGKTPEGEKPERPGFMVFGTQNPITMSGRRAMSSALGHRLMTLTLPSYSAKELQQILVKEGLKAQEAEAWVKLYHTEKDLAIAQKRAHIPCDRDIITLAKNRHIGQMVMPKPSISMKTKLKKQRLDYRQKEIKTPPKLLSKSEQISQIKERLKKSKPASSVSRISYKNK